MTGSYNTARRDRSDGFAIPAAVFVIVILSLLALAGLYVAGNNATANSGLRYSLKALYAADAGAMSQLADWDRSTRFLNPGDSMVTGWQELEDGSRYNSSILRVDDGSDSLVSLFRLRTVGRPAAGITAQRTVTTMVQVDHANGLCCDAAIKTQGRLRIQGSGSRVKVSGIDSDPPTWSGECPGTATDQPGVRIQDDDNLRINGNPTLEGTPPVLEDGSIDSDDFTQFGDVTYEDLARIADKRLAGGSYASIAPQVTGGACVKSNPTNWGDPLDPTSPCFDYLPIIHVAGDLRLTGTGYGQGILLVDGDLDVSGTFDFFGIAVVLGEADFHGTSAMSGGLLVRNGVEAGDQSFLRGNTTVQYSSCAAGRALANAIIARPLAGRHWFEPVE